MTPSDKSSGNGFRITHSVLFKVIGTLAAVCLGGYMVAAALWGSAVINRLDKHESRLANIEGLQSSQTSDIKIIKNELQREVEQGKLLSGLRENITELRIEIERLKNK